jgi:aarF domain-containing kinase
VPVFDFVLALLPWHADLLDASANAPHWGSMAAAESVQSAAQWVRTRVPTPGGPDLARLLGELQTSLASSLQQLSSLPQLPDTGEQQLSGALADSLEQVVQQLQRVAASAQRAAESLSSAELREGAPSGGATPLSSHLSSRLGQLSSGTYAGYSLQTLAWVAAGVAALIALSVPRDSGPPGGTGGGDSGSGTGSNGGAPGRADTLPSSWDAPAVSRYFSTRPVLVARRLLQVAAEALSFGAALAVDMATGRVGAAQAKSANKAMAAIERLGPAYVKVAQALSTRVDLLPPAYLVAIQRLQVGIRGGAGGRTPLQCCAVPCWAARRLG